MQTVNPDGFPGIVTFSEQGLVILISAGGAWHADLR
jgi:hypothetical protein